MRRSHTHTAPLIALLTGLMAPTARADAIEGAGNPITFRFAPPEITFERRATTQRTRTMSDGAHQLDETSGTDTIRISREGEHYRMEIEPASLTVKRNGVTVNNPLLNTLQTLEVVYTLDTEGRLESVTGYEVVPDMLAQMASNLPEKTKQALMTAFSAEALRTREQAEHKGRIEDFVGLQVKIGSVTTGASAYTLPTGETVDLTNAIHFSSTEPCGNTTCVVIDHVYNSDPRALPGMMTDILDSLPIPKGEGSSDGTMAIEGRVRRLIDPATMLIHTENIERTIRMTIEAPGQKAISMTLTENRSYAYTYPERTDG